jgi:peroxiredoxin
MNGIWLISYIALWALVLLLVIVLVGALRHIGILYRRGGQGAPATTLKAGDALPDAPIRNIQGEATRISRFRGTPTRFLIVSPQCSGCKAILEQLAHLPLDADRGQIVVLSMADLAETISLTSDLQLPSIYPVLLDPDGFVREKWGITATPLTVVVDQDLKVTHQFVGAIDAPTFTPVPAALSGPPARMTGLHIERDPQTSI